MATRITRGLVRAATDEGFRTSNTAAYPWEMCQKLARAILSDFVQRLLSKQTLETGGGSTQSPAPRQPPGGLPPPPPPPPGGLAAAAAATPGGLFFAAKASGEEAG